MVKISIIIVLVSSSVDSDILFFQKKNLSPDENWGLVNRIRTFC